MEQTVIQIGNSQGIVIPADIKRKMGLKKGQKLFVQMSNDKDSFVVSKTELVADNATTERFVEIVDRVNKRYSSALKELAEK